MCSLLTDLSRVEQAIGVIFVIGALLLLGIPGEIPWLTPYQSRTIGTTIIAILIIIAGYKVWSREYDKREALQSEKDSKAPDVKLKSYTSDLQYEVNRNRKGLIEIHLDGELVNDSLQNSGRLHHFEIEVLTERGGFTAKAERPRRNYLFEPGAPHELIHFIFLSKMSDDIPRHMGIEFWEPLIRGKEGNIVLKVSGQEPRSYRIRIADEGTIWESKILA